ncbi:MAG: Gfo/Idh/MocA family oxidoreductase [Candidatus Thermoplasmatota archaeon]|nr:Gfo/Idh/MocA family oxidoreductase [Candidatus Thermoplasmatota archaeon]
MRIGVIGVGSMGQNHARILADMGLLAGVSDISPEAAKKVGDRYSVPYMTKHSDLLKEDIDAVIIVTPTTTHKKVASCALRAGKHVLLEKPMTGSSKDLVELNRQASRSKLVLAGGFVERHNPVVSFARNSLQKGDFGTLITAATRRVSSLPSRIRDIGVVMDLGIHDMDVVQHVVGERALSVYALGGTGKGIKFEDHANILIDFEKGATGFIEVNWLTPMRVRKLALTCDKNFVEVDYMDQSVQVCSSTFKPFEPGNLFNVPIDFDLRRVALRKEEPLRRELNDFISAMKDGKDPLVTGESAVHTLKIAEAALKSMKSGRKELVR